MAGNKPGIKQRWKAAVRNVVYLMHSLEIRRILKKCEGDICIYARGMVEDFLDMKPLSKEEVEAGMRCKRAISKLPVKARVIAKRKLEEARMRTAEDLLAGCDCG
jgi:hypothetical protein